MKLLVCQLCILPWLLAVLCQAQSQSKSSDNVCTSLTTCGQCIRVPNCVWCSRESTSRKDRCQLRQLMADCPAYSLIDPVAEYHVLKNPSLTQAFQLRPSVASLTNLRIGQVFNLSVQYNVAKDYPADLYFLMDVSISMEDDKKNLVRLGETLAETMRNMTADFQLGYGSFVDKNAVPFVKWTGESCGSQEIGCAVTYSFKHQMDLSDNTKTFTQKVNSTQIVRTFDNPEGGFDALMQAMVCKDRIGWRDRARRLILFATDATSHMAGHGRLGGIIKPNDGKCHLDVNGMYSEPLSQDYPSLGHISRVAKDHSMNVIFAVTNEVASIYKEFTNKIPGSSIGTLDSNSQNIVTLIRDRYQDITSSVEMKDTSGAGINIRYYTACTGSMVQENNKCDGLKVGATVSFTVSVEITECPLDPAERKQDFKIYPVGVNEALDIHLEMACDCPCEKEGNSGFVPDAEECNNRGDLQCGICVCHEGYSGEHCECSGDADIAHLESLCKMDNSSNVLCSDRGNCFCGICECQTRSNPAEVISGKYCECDNFSCDRINNKICAGNGECNCGQCVCFTGWSGKACDCQTSDEACIPIGGGDICSGNGICDCGTCQCSPNSAGRYCEDCPTCPSRCSEFEPCVKCKVFNTGPYKDGRCDTECTYSIVIEDIVEVEQTSERDCFYENDQSCKVKFIYGFGSRGERRVRVQSEPICPVPVPAMAIGVGLLVGILLVGILTLILWRLSTYLYDKKEYARFIKERDAANWNREMNPLYVTPTQMYKNPMYDS